MIRRLIPGFFALFCTACVADVPRPAGFYDCTGPALEADPVHPLAGGLQSFLDERVAAGLPGMSLSVITPDHGQWSGTAGRAELIGDVSLQPCHFFRAGSTVKTVTAVAVLKLWEAGKVDLDAPVSDYLPASLLAGIENADVATVRQLLQHTGGLNNYIRNLEFQTASLNHFTRVWSAEELLTYSRGVPADFPPGEDAVYSNTGYILLGMLVEAVTGEPFHVYFEREIFQPLQLTYTRFAAPDPVPPGIVRGYIDMYDNGELVDATQYSGWDYFTADGGLLSNPQDLARFLAALFSGSLLGPEAIHEMTQWRYPAVADPESFRTGYGLGIFVVDTDFGPAYLHSGDAVGYFATMIYFPEREVAISWAANGNYGRLDDLQQSKQVMEEVFRLLFAG